MGKDLENKKINNEQQLNEGFSGENISDDYNPSKGKLKPEAETDKEGNTKTVDRARNPDTAEHKSSDVSPEVHNGTTVENKDRNSDITPNRYPNSHPDNHKNRGNMELDED